MNSENQCIQTSPKTEMAEKTVDWYYTDFQQKRANKDKQTKTKHGTRERKYTKKVNLVIS